MEKRTILENSNTRSNNLTLIKFIAAIMVIWGHAIILLQQSKDPISLLSRNELSLGSVAVAIFFFASGFYVTKSLMKNMENIFRESEFLRFRRFPAVN